MSRIIALSILALLCSTCLAQAPVQYPVPSSVRPATSSSKPSAARENSSSKIQVRVDNFGGVKATRSQTAKFPRLAAEYETTRVLMLSMGDWQSHHRYILKQIADKTAGRVNLMILCNDLKQVRESTRWLLEDDPEQTSIGRYDHVYFSEVPLDSVWLRDFGPIFTQTSKGAQSLDFFYVGQRPKDDRLPKEWCRNTSCEYVRVPWTIQGGNLISNGKGLALTTLRIFDDNRITFPNPTPNMNVEFERRRMVVEPIVKYCNLSELVVLEPLQNESTRHVDMFATFISPDQVLVAEVDPRRDPINAAILNRNTQRLQSVRVDGKPLRVHRIAIPVRENTTWSAYTNAIIAGRLVLIPVFKTDARSIVNQAIAVYRKLLPNHQIETVDMSSMKQLQGELHCLSLHVPDFVPMPKRIYSFRSSVETYFPAPRKKVLRKKVLRKTVPRKKQRGSTDLTANKSSTQQAAAINQ